MLKIRRKERRTKAREKRAAASSPNAFRKRKIVQWRDEKISEEIFDFFVCLFHQRFFSREESSLSNSKTLDLFLANTHTRIIIKVGCIRAKDEEFWNDDERKEREGEERKREEPSSRVFLRTRRRFRKGKKKKKKKR